MLVDMALRLCTECAEQMYDDAYNDDPGGRCMRCLNFARLIVNSQPQELPPHTITEDSINAVGERSVRVLYADGSTDLFRISVNDEA